MFDVEIRTEDTIIGSGRSGALVGRDSFLSTNILPALIALGAAAAPSIIDAVSGDDEAPQVKDWAVGQAAKEWGMTDHSQQGNDAANLRARGEGFAGAPRYNPLADQTMGQFGRDQMYAGAGNAAGSRGEQAQGLGLMRDAAYGRTPSLAQIQMRQGLDQGMAQNRMLAASARGGGVNAAAASRLALMGNAQMAQQTAAGAAALRAREMEAARASYFGGAGQMRGQDLGQLGQGAGMYNQQTQANLAGQGMMDQNAQWWTSQGINQQNAQLAREFQLANLKLAQQTGNAGFTQQQNANNAAASAAALNTGAQIAPFAYQLAKGEDNPGGQTTGGLVPPKK